VLHIIYCNGLTLHTGLSMRCMNMGNATLPGELSLYMSYSSRGYDPNIRVVRGDKSVSSEVHYSRDLQWTG
jgi:hypothetical protein